MSFCRYAQHLCGLPAGLSSLMDGALEGLGSLAAIRQMQTGGRLAGACRQTHKQQPQSTRTLFEMAARKTWTRSTCVPRSTSLTSDPPSLFTSYSMSQLLLMKEKQCFAECQCFFTMHALLMLDFSLLYLMCFTWQSWNISCTINMKREDKRNSY